jgi:hypothetical protein
MCRSHAWMSLSLRHILHRARNVRGGANHAPVFASGPRAAGVWLYLLISQEIHTHTHTHTLSLSLSLSPRWNSSYSALAFKFRQWAES